MSCQAVQHPRGPALVIPRLFTKSKATTECGLFISFSTNMQRFIAPSMSGDDDDDDFNPAVSQDDNANTNNNNANHDEKKKKKKTIAGKPRSLFARLSLSPESKHRLSALATIEQHQNQYGSPVVKYDYMWKRGHVNVGWKLRFFLLTKDQKLYYFKTEEKKKPQGWVDLGEVEYKVAVYHDPLKEFAFHLVPLHHAKMRTWFISAASALERERWIEAIQSVMKGTTSKTEINMVRNLKESNYCIPPEDLDLKRKLDAGASGAVWVAEWKKCTPVAVKKLNNDLDFINPNEKQAFLHEVVLLSQLRHPSILSMYGYCLKDGFLCLVTEYIEGGNLSQLIHESDVRYNTIEIAISLCRGMVFLHSENVVHRDLKPGNILVENAEEAKVKVCDFGLSSTLISKKFGDTLDHRDLPVFGSPAYAAPELPQLTHTNKVDVFSFGMILWELETRKEISSVYGDFKIPEQVLQGVRPPIPFGSALGPLIQRCWATNPDHRPSFPEVFQELKALQSSNPKDLYGRKIINGFQDQESVNWAKFANILNLALGVPLLSVDRLKWILCRDDGSVYKNDWLYFISWFAPLVVYSDYLNLSSPSYNPIGYSFDEIVAITKQPHFFGFLSSEFAKTILSNKPDGSFLLRFSSKLSPKPHVSTFAISVKLPEEAGGAVGHWRLTCEKLGRGRVIIKVEDKERDYTSFQEFFQVHKTEPLESSTDQGVHCFLLHPCDRVAEFGS